jgi:hypothetical protein
MKHPLALAAWLLLGSGVAAAAPPVVVSTPIEAQTFVDNLDVGVPIVRKNLSDALLRLTRAHFPVLDWSESAQAPEAQLTLALTEHDVGGNAPEVRLTWSAKVGGKPMEMATLKPIIVYDSVVIVRALHSPSKLSTLLTNKLDTWFGEAGNLENFKKNFLNLVPVARRVTIDAPAERIVLPLSMSAGKFDQRSTLIVHIVASQGSPPRKGTISVSDLSEQASAATLASVSVFDVHPVPKTTGWSPDIAALFRNPVDAYVLLDNYIFSNVPTLNGNMLTPTPVPAGGGGGP